MTPVCNICPHRCQLGEGRVGLCRARKNDGGAVTCFNYGMITSMALDPIEKKPLARFFPGSTILSVGSWGCNLRCSFCQNSEISMANVESSRAVYVSPEELVNKALSLVPRNNIGLAFTYNEPLISYEYVRDCAIIAKKSGLKIVLVTNGMICSDPLIELLHLIDAMNIDLKGFTEQFYKKLGGDLETVKQTIRLSAEKCHVEITTLIIPGENDTDGEMDALSGWLSAIRPDIPLHITRFFPRYRMRDREPTPINTLYRLREVAKRHLDYVYIGNI
ncbi:MAG: AmmeMemoRadiSam system radical SAM enzyme [Oscillospiraceae bacterium]|jgi:pyruvate formate lyase activating enzyme